MRTKTLLLPVAASLALLAGCTQPGPQAPAEPTTNGVENLSAAEIQQRAIDALTAAGSFRASGVAVADGQTMSGEFAFSDTGDMSMAVEALGMGSLEFRFVDDAVYVRGEGLAAMLGSAAEMLPAEPAQLLALMDGRWVAIPAGTGFGDSLPLKPADLLRLDGAEVTKGEVTEYKGQQVIELKGGEATVLIALTGEPLPVAIVIGEATLELFDFGKDVTVEAPPAAETIDIVTLMMLAAGQGSVG